LRRQQHCGSTSSSNGMRPVGSSSSSCHCTNSEPA
jgi:hypothetical protein